MKCGDSEVINITRSEANFDRACDEAYRLAVGLLDIDENGHSSRIEDWERHRCWIELEFVKYVRHGGMGGCCHLYTFSAKPMKSEPDEDEDE